jgi:SAM-dependent methyltransferase
MSDLYQSPADYDAYYDGWTALDMPFWSGLIERLGARLVLELGCGTGRLTIPLARAVAPLGCQVVGLDLAPALLTYAETKLEAEPAAVRAAVRLVEGDMRDFSLPERFDLIFIPFNTLADLDSIDDQVASLTAARRHLAPGGRLAVDVALPGLDELHQESTGPTPPQIDGWQIDPTTGQALMRYRRRAYQRHTQTSQTHFSDEVRLPSGEVVQRERDYRQHVFFPREVELLFRLAGYRVAETFGDYYAQPFGPTSPQLIALGVTADG